MPQSLASAEVTLPRGADADARARTVHPKYRSVRRSQARSRDIQSALRRSRRSVSLRASIHLFLEKMTLDLFGRRAHLSAMREPQCLPEPLGLPGIPDRQTNCLGPECAVLRSTVVPFFVPPRVARAARPQCINYTVVIRSSQAEKCKPSRGT